jgi:hypothetical protein
MTDAERAELIRVTRNRHMAYRYIKGRHNMPINLARYKRLTDWAKTELSKQR